MNEDNPYVYTPEVGGNVGAVQPLSSEDHWTEADELDYEQRLARKRPLGFSAVWPTGDAVVSEEELHARPKRRRRR